MTQKTSQHLLAFHNAIVYFQQKEFLTELVSSGDLYFTKPTWFVNLDDKIV